MKRHAGTSIPSVKKGIPSTVVVVLGTCSVHTHLAINICRVVTLEEESHFRRLTLSKVNCSDIVALALIVNELIVLALCRIELSTPVCIEFAFLALLSRHLIVVHLSCHLNRRLLHSLALCIFESEDSLAANGAGRNE